jgi:hypothetical protein
MKHPSDTLRDSKPRQKLNRDDPDYRYRIGYAELDRVTPNKHRRKEKLCRHQAHCLTVQSLGSTAPQQYGKTGDEDQIEKKDIQSPWRSAKQHVAEEPNDKSEFENVERGCGTGIHFVVEGRRARLIQSQLMRPNTIVASGKAMAPISMPPER